MSTNSKEAVLAAAKRTAMARGYNGLNFRDIALEVGIKAPSIYHHFPTKADLGAAVARRYWEDTVHQLDAISDESSDPLVALHRYPGDLPQIVIERQSDLSFQLHGRGI